MDNAPQSAALRNFSAHAIFDKEINYTIVGGRFSPSSSIDLPSQVVSLSIAGAAGFQISLPVGSFKRTVLDGYVASHINNSSKTEILLQPFRGGDWAYSAGIEGFVAGSRLVTVSLTIGSQAGRSRVKVFAFGSKPKGADPV